MFLYFFIHWLFIFQGTSAGHTECGGELTCRNDTLIDDYVLCGSYKSCANSPFIETNERYSTTSDHENATNAIACSGDRSCLNVDKMISQDSIYCIGDQSCANCLNLTATRWLWCPGSGSCYNIQALMNQSDSYGYTYIPCYGDQSCANSVFTTIGNASVVIGNGAYSLINSVININGARDHNGNTTSYNEINLRGYYAGYNLTINCQNESSVYCKLCCYGNACNSTTINCFDENNCNIECEFDDYGDCPSRITYEQRNTNQSNSQRLGSLLLLPSSINEMDHLEMIVDIYDLSNQLSSVCNGVSDKRYSAAYTCDYFDNKCGNNTILIDPRLANWTTSSYEDWINSNNTNKNEMALCCWGASSCKFSFIKVTDNILEFVDEHSEYIYNDTNTNFDINIVCSAYKSCEQAMIEAKIVNTSQSQRVINKYDIYMTNMTMNIWCLADSSCHKSTITNTNINNMSTTVYCSGENSCKDAIIENVDTIYCDGGDSACANVSITGVENVLILGSGYDTFGGSVFNSSYSNYNENSTISYTMNRNSRDWNINIMNVFIMTSLLFTNRYNYTQFYCNGVNDLCYFECGTKGACGSDKTYISCMENIKGLCVIYCDEDNGIECPNVTSVNDNYCIVDDAIDGGIGDYTMSEVLIICGINS